MVPQSGETSNNGIMLESHLEERLRPVTLTA